MLVRPVGGMWGITCYRQSPGDDGIVALTWETADREELQRSTSFSIIISGVADLSLELTCYGWSVDNTKTPLMFVSLIVQGEYL